MNRKAERADSGIYKLILKNSEGTCQVQFRVNVLAAPGKPEGPLEATHVTAEGCTLGWKPPVRYHAIETNVLRVLDYCVYVVHCRKTMAVVKSNIILLNVVKLAPNDGPKLALQLRVQIVTSKA